MPTSAPLAVGVTSAPFGAPCPSDQPYTPIHLALRLPEHLESIMVWGSKNPLLSIGYVDVRLDHDVALEDIVEEDIFPEASGEGSPAKGKSAQRASRMQRSHCGGPVPCGKKVAR